MNSNWSYSPETVKLGCDFCDLDLWPWPFAWTSLLSLVITPENFMMIRWWEHSQKGVTDRQTDGKYHSLSCLVAAKNNRAPLLYYIKPCVSFQIHRWIQTEVTLLKRSIRVEIGDFLSLVTLKFDGWPWKTTGHLFHTTSSLCIISNPSVNWKWSYSPEKLNLGQNWQFFVPCDLEIWRMPLKNNRAPLLCCFKLCASFHSHLWIQTGVTVRKRPIWVKFDDL